ncbi:hypothetical protein CEXT_473051 [Caerostris extrusa]|uniref:Uncharacterized protein n=1 Tax=Caerostris extrusa TaxID=172846 RepID=A0AAV4NH34_CAEEX|nr:hypothetical protein CEXT_473051 [Caerostris extrusa]
MPPFHLQRKTRITERSALMSKHAKTSKPSVTKEGIRYRCRNSLHRPPSSSKRNPRLKEEGILNRRRFACSHPAGDHARCLRCNEIVRPLPTPGTPLQDAYLDSPEATHRLIRPSASTR